MESYKISFKRSKKIIHLIHLIYVHNKISYLTILIVLMYNIIITQVYRKGDKN